MQHIFSAHPSLQCEHRQNRQRHQTNSLVADRVPGQNSQGNKRSANSASPDRVHPNPCTRSGFRLRAPRSRLLRLNSWCTGKDSNLRTSQGGTDLQSVGFNHSPTCAKTSPFGLLQLGNRMMQRAAGNDPIEKSECAQKSFARKHHTWKNSLWSAVGKNLLRRRAAQNALCSGTEPGLSGIKIKCWSWRRDLNPRPSDYKSDALPTELRQQSGITSPRGRMYPSDPFQMSGTILKGTITVIRVQLLVRLDQSATASIFVAPASCRLSRGHLALGGEGGTPSRQPPRRRRYEVQHREP